MRRELSKEEREYFQEQLSFTLDSLSSDNLEVLKNDIELSDEALKKVISHYQHLSEVSFSLDVPTFGNYFKGIQNVASLSLLTRNPRVRKKVSYMACDYANLLEILVCSLDKPDRLKGVIKAFEILTQKQDRLKQGEFYKILARGRSAS